MKHWRNLIVESVHIKIGRGQVLVVDLQKSGVVDDLWVDDILIRRGDTVEHNNLTWEIIAIESVQNLLVSGKTKAQVGLLVKVKK